MKKLIGTLVILAISIGCTHMASAQDAKMDKKSAYEKSIKNMVDSAALLF